jgi:hypothetical protein
LSRLEKTLWILIIIYTIIEASTGRLTALLFLTAIIIVRMIIWRLKQDA